MTSEAEYTDGDVELELLAYFENRKPMPPVESWDWPLTYHLSPLRGNLVSWIDFPPGSRVLEVGAGCGAVTAALATKGIELTSMELSEQRTRVNRARNGHYPNVTFETANLQNMGDSGEFDAVICVGVLEYAGSFLEADEPYAEFVRLLRRQLKVGGDLYLAIENRLGLKYWSGAKEDHTGSLFEGIEGYPGHRRVQTFSREQLSELLHRNGFPSVRFHYPFPDYKLPRVIYGEPALIEPQLQSILAHQFLPGPSWDQPGQRFFDQGLAARQLVSSSLMHEFSNSFMVMATDSDLADRSELIAYIGQPERALAYRTETRIVRDAGDVSITKSGSEQAHDHVAALVRNHAEFNETTAAVAGLRCVDLVSPTAGVAVADYVPGSTVEDRLNDLLLDRRFDDAVELLNRFVDVVKELSATSVRLPADLIFDNLVLADDGVVVFVDNEWTEIEISLELLVARAMFTHFRRFASLYGRFAESVPTSVVGAAIVPDVVLAEFAPFFLLSEPLANYESELQSVVQQRVGDHVAPSPSSEPTPLTVNRPLNALAEDVEIALVSRDESITTLHEQLMAHIAQLDQARDESVRSHDDLTEHVAIINDLRADLLKIGDERNELTSELAVLRDRVGELEAELNAVTNSRAAMGARKIETGVLDIARNLKRRSDR